MESEKSTYLQMIQEPISRMSTNSAIFKGFAATIVAGVAALSYADINNWILGLSFLPVITFLMLDTYYLTLERRYRLLYNQVREGTHPVDFSLSINYDSDELKAAKARARDCLLSPSILLFYPLLIAVLIVVFILSGNHAKWNANDQDSCQYSHSISKCCTCSSNQTGENASTKLIISQWTCLTWCGH